MLFFDIVVFEGIIKKLIEFNFILVVYEVFFDEL